MIKELLAIEKSVREAEKTEAPDDGLIRSEISRGIAALEGEADARMAEMERDSSAQTEERIAQIKEAYKRKADKLEALFFVNRETWPAQIVKAVLDV